MKCVVLAMLLAQVPAMIQAQPAAADTIVVTLVKKSPQHPAFGRVWDSCLAFNGVEAARPTLVRGRMVVFLNMNVRRMARMTFFTADWKQWFAGLPPYETWLSDTLRFIPPSQTPDVLRYESSWRFESGGWVDIVDSTATGFEEDRGRLAAGAHAIVVPNPFAESAVIRYSIPGATSARLEVYDALGRQVYAASAATTGGGGAFRLSAANTGTGLFLYRISDGSVSLTGTLTVVR